MTFQPYNKWYLQNNEIEEIQYNYCGYTIKIFSIYENEKKYYGAADINDYYPSLHIQMHAAEKEIQNFIDNIENRK